MPRKVADTRMTARTARDKVRMGKRLWKVLDRGLALGYRRGPEGGTWYAKLLVGGDKYTVTALGTADDRQEADGVNVLDFSQAQERARAWADGKRRELRGDDVPTKGYTVRDAALEYLAWFQTRKKSYRFTKGKIDKLILPQLGDVPLVDLTKRKLENWLTTIVEQGPLRRARKGADAPTFGAFDASDPEAMRARKATANRTWTILRAVLNHAHGNGKVVDNAAWKRIKPFRNADTPRVRFLTLKDCGKLLEACLPDFRLMVHAALLTGCRYSELARLRVGDYHAGSGTLFIGETKSGKPRHVPLTDEGKGFFAEQITDRMADEVMFLKADGSPWQLAEPRRRLMAACAAAKIAPAIDFHGLRHSYASLLAGAGVPLQVIAAVLGHRDTRMVEKHYAHLQPNYVAATIKANLPKIGTGKAKVVALPVQRPA